MIIGNLQSRDILGCSQIVEQNWDVENSRKAWREMSMSLRYPDFNIFYYTAFTDGKLVGFAGMMPSWIMSNVWDFIWINIHPDYQDKGIGSVLTKHRLEQVEKRGGAIVQLFTESPLFFERFGFKITNRYSGGIWVSMAKQLAPVKL